MVAMKELIKVVLGQRFEARHIQRLKRVGSVRREDKQQNLVLISVIDEGLRHMAAVPVKDK